MYESYIIERDDKKYALTNNLRFILRNGEKVLQQLCREHHPFGNVMTERDYTWMDVPLESDDENFKEAVSKE